MKREDREYQIGYNIGAAGRHLPVNCNKHVKAGHRDGFLNRKPDPRRPLLELLLRPE